MNVRKWFIETKGPRPVVIAVVAMLVVLLAIIGAQKASAKDSKMYTVEDASSFKTHFKAGDFSHARKSIGYSTAFRKMWKAQYIRSEIRWYKNHPSQMKTDCTDTHTCAGWTSAGDAWTSYTNRDSCAVSVGNDFSSVACQLNDQEAYNIGHLVDSPYWTKRGDLQNTWTGRVLFCGGIGVAIFFTGGTAAAAVGPGALGCLGAFVVK